jgi:ATP-dependent RNA helicase RhlE
VRRAANVCFVLIDVFHRTDLGRAGTAPRQSQEHPTMPFSTLGLSPALCAPLAGKGYATPTPVQSASIPLVLDGADLVARAQTGTGKTAAFGLPMIDRLLVRGSRGRTHAPRALVLVPTRELAVQLQRALTTYGEPVRLRVTAVFGGVSMGNQIQALRRGTDVVVATPGRLIDHLNRRTIDLSTIEILTLDEADRMLDMGFLPPLRRVLAALPRQRQTLMFSATLPPAVDRLAAEFTRNARRVDVSARDVVAPTVTHRIHRVAADRKRALLLHVLGQPPAGQALVFCRTKRGADRVGDHLESGGLRVAVIHGNKTQGARSRSLADFRAARVSVLVATDVAARGLDIAQLPLVVNYDLPLVAEDYVHRVGRTGRAGATGHAVSFVTADEAHLLRDIQRLVASPLESVAVEGFEKTGGLSAAEPIARHRQPGRGRHARAVSRPGAPGATSAARSGAGARPRRHDRRRSPALDGLR